MKRDSFAKIVGQRLREARTEAGLTQRDCAKAIGINNSTAYCYYEQGKRRIQLENLVRLSNFLNKPISFFFLEGDKVEYPDKYSRNYDYRIGGETKDYYRAINANYSFSSFYTDSSNMQAYILAKSVIESDWRSINPLYIYSSEGTGKTHLLQSIGNAALDNRMGVIIEDGLSLSNKIKLSLEENQVQKLMAYLLSFDLLIIDDIDYLGADDYIQATFCRIIEEYCNNGKIITMASRKSPESIQHFSESTKNKIRSGPVVRMEIPNALAWAKILKLKSIERGWYIPEDIARMLVGRLKTNGHLLKGLTQHFIALKRKYNKIPNIDIAKYLLEREYNRRGEFPKAVNPKEILSAVAGYFGIAVEELTGKRRDGRSSFARQIAAYLLKEDIELSFAEIGYLLGNRDHSTVIYSWKKANEKINADNDVNNMIFEIRSCIYAS